MSTSLATRRYYFGCGFLYAVLSTWHHLLDAIATAEVGERYLRWSGAHADLADWLLNEQLFATNLEHATEREDTILYHAWMKLADALVFHWRATICSATHNAHKLEPDVAQEMHAYYFYCHWLLHVLAEFERLIQGSPLRATEFYRRYHEDAGKFAELTRSTLANSSEGGYTRAGNHKMNH